MSANFELYLETNSVARGKICSSTNHIVSVTWFVTMNGRLAFSVL